MIIYKERYCLVMYNSEIADTYYIEPDAVFEFCGYIGLHHSYYNLLTYIHWKHNL